MLLRFCFYLFYQILFPSGVLHHVAPSVMRNMDWSAIDTEAGVKAEDDLSDDTDQNTEDDQSDDSSQKTEEYSSSVTDMSTDSDVMEDKCEFCEASVRC